MNFISFAPIQFGKYAPNSPQSPGGVLGKEISGAMDATPSGFSFTGAGIGGTIGTLVSPGVGTAIGAVGGGLLGGVGGSAAWGGIKGAAIGGLAGFASPIPGGAAMGAVVGAGVGVAKSLVDEAIKIVKIWEKLSAVSENLSKVYGEFSSKLSRTASDWERTNENINRKWASAIENITSKMGKTGQGFMERWTDIKIAVFKAFEPLLNSMLDWLTKLGNFAMKILETLTRFLQNFMDFMRLFVAFASDIATTPTRITTRLTGEEGNRSWGQEGIRMAIGLGPKDFANWLVHQGANALGLNKEDDSSIIGKGLFMGPRIGAGIVHGIQAGGKWLWNFLNPTASAEEIPNSFISPSKTPEISKPIKREDTLSEEFAKWLQNFMSKHETVRSYMPSLSETADDIANRDEQEHNMGSDIGVPTWWSSNVGQTKAGWHKFGPLNFTNNNTRQGGPVPIPPRIRAQTNTGTRVPITNLPISAPPQISTKGAPNMQDLWKDAYLKDHELNPQKLATWYANLKPGDKKAADAYIAGGGDLASAYHDYMSHHDYDRAAGGHVLQDEDSKLSALWKKSPSNPENKPKQSGRPDVGPTPGSSQRAGQEHPTTQPSVSSGNFGHDGSHSSSVRSDASYQAKSNRGADALVPVSDDFDKAVMEAIRRLRASISKYDMDSTLRAFQLKNEGTYA